MRREWNRGAGLIAALALIGCGGGGGDKPTGTTAGFTVALSSSTLTVPVGTDGSITATIGRTGTFAGTVTLTVENLPAGITASFSPAVITTGVTTTVLNVSVANTVVAGQYSFTVRGTSAGYDPRTATVTLTAAPPPSFLMTLLSQAFNVAQGSSGQTTINFGRTSFTGGITMSVEGLPTGVTASFSTNPATGASTILTISATSAVPLGPVPLVVKGTATGIPVQSEDLTITIVLPPSFSMDFAPPSLTIQRGNTGNTTATITRAGSFAGPVTLSATGLPTGVSFSTSTNPVVGPTSTITFTVDNSAPTGQHTVTLHGTGDGVAPKDVTFILTVTAGATGQLVSLAFCGSSIDIPLWVAYQSESGPWTVATNAGNNTYQISIGTKGGLAYVTQLGANQYVTNLIYGTLADFQNQAPAFCRQPRTKAVTGTVTGYETTDNVSVSLGGAIGSVALNHTFQIDLVPFGVQDLLGVRSVFANPGFTPFSVLIQRNLNPPDDSDIGLVNFATATPLATGTASVSNTFGESFYLYSSLFTAHSNLLVTIGASSTAASRVYYGIPNSLLIGTDVQQLTAHAVTITGSNLHIRDVSKFFTSVGAIDLPFGSPMPEPDIFIAGTTNYVRLRGVVSREPDYRTFTNFTFQQGLPTGLRQVSISATGGYFGGTADFDITMPDWHGLPNWQDAYGLETGHSLQWLVTGNGWSVPGGVLSPTPVSGTIVKTAAYSGSFNIP